MSDIPQDQLTQKLTILEEQVARLNERIHSLRLILFFAGAVFLLSLFFSYRLHVGLNDSPFLRVLSDDKERAVLESTEDSVSLRLKYCNGRDGAVLSLNEVSGPTLLFTDSDGNRLTSITGKPAAVICADTQGAPKAILAVSQGGTGLVSVTESDGTPIIFQRAAVHNKPPNDGTVNGR